ncbi:hypothetical protein B0H63DRAFT_86350 [Podospora didyma]|uniref:Uncharacterized protein n=1 Tax=Podospora didyma TaxID=330526 RepID=A0AAE0N202_9PEZI|nr:hypothetical protein B0H63DRAFT_86350 [Podospora didyma]
MACCLLCLTTWGLLSAHALGQQTDCRCYCCQMASGGGGVKMQSTSWVTGWLENAGKLVRRVHSDAGPEQFAEAVAKVSSGTDDFDLELNFVTFRNLVCHGYQDSIRGDEGNIPDQLRKHFISRISGVADGQRPSCLTMDMLVLAQENWKKGTSSWRFWVGMFHSR